MCQNSKIYIRPGQHNVDSPSLVAALLNVPPEADLLEVVGAVPLHEVVPAALRVPVQTEATLPVIVDGEGRTVGSLRGRFSQGRVKHG